MEQRSRAWQSDLAGQVNEPLTAITALLGTADAYAGDPDEVRRCLHEIGLRVKELADACHHLVGEADRGAAQAARAGALVGLAAVELTPGQRLVGVLDPELSPAGERAALDPELAAQLVERLRPSGTPRPDQLARLTPQERRIFGLIGQGCTNRQIAQRLFLAEKTVKNYVSNMLRKLGMERRTQAAVFASALDRREWAGVSGTSRPA